MAREGFHTVRLEHFRARPADVGSKIETPFELAGEHWALRVYPGGVNLESINYVSAFLIRPDDVLGKCRAEFNFCIHGQNGVTSPERIDFGSGSSSLIREFETGSAYGFRKTKEYARTTVLGRLIDEALIFHIRLRVFGDSNIEPKEMALSPGRPYAYFPAPARSLAADVGKLGCK